MAKAGVACPFCKGTPVVVEEDKLRKTFDFDDTDLKKSQ